MTEFDPAARRRSRWQLLLIAAMFFGSFAIAASLFFGGWKPGATRNFGELLNPYPALQGIDLRHANGEAYDWQPEADHWRILVVAPDACGTPCLQLLTALHRVWYSEGRHANRLQILWVGELPASAPTFSGLQPLKPSAELVAQLPQASTALAVPVYLVDPSGYVVLHYRPGFKPAELRKDLARLLK